MSKARPSKAVLRERLREGHFTAARPVDAMAADPLAPTAMVVPVDDIAGYEHNPRQAPNPAFEAIKSSIDEEGLHQPLVITRRPGAERYTVMRGGNTRLHAIQELFRETGDSRFEKIHCLFEPWAGESVALLGHLIENDTRGDLTFLDRARAIDVLKALLEHDLDTELSQRRLATLLNERGYRISPILISQMAYALSELAPVLPQAFQSGLGGDRVQRLRTLNHAGQAIWRRRELGAPEHYRGLFREMLARTDQPDWRYALARDGLVEQLAACASATAIEIQAELNVQLTNSTSPPATAPSEPSPTLSTSATEECSEQANAPADHGSTGRLIDDADAVPNARPASTPAGEAPTNPPTVPKQLPDDIKSLRARAWTLATKLARHYRIDHLIRPLPQTGLGYTVIEVIDPDMLAKHNAIKAGEIGSLWWHLVACAELTSAPHQALPSILKASSVLLRALSASDWVSLLDGVPACHVSQLATALWSRMDERDWRDLVALMDTHRRLHRLAAHQDIALWHEEEAS